MSHASIQAAYTADGHIRLYISQNQNRRATETINFDNKEAGDKFEASTSVLSALPHGLSMPITTAFVQLAHADEYELEQNMTYIETELHGSVLIWT